MNGNSDFIHGPLEGIVLAALVLLAVGLSTSAYRAKSLLGLSPIEQKVRRRNRFFLAGLSAAAVAAWLIADSMRH